MKCPSCEGEFDPIELRSVSGRLVDAKHCTQCGGIWLPRLLSERLLPESVANYDVPQPNYSLKTFDMLCPIDKTLLDTSDHSQGPNGSKFWRCPDCEGGFFPRGQLSLLTNWQAGQVDSNQNSGLQNRARAASGVALTLILVVVTLSSLNKFNLQYLAADGSPLPTSGPNILTLALLALAYIAGTVLAVLGRRLPLIVTGWSVIAICLFGFSVVIFGP